MRRLELTLKQISYTIIIQRYSNIRAEMEAHKVKVDQYVETQGHNFDREM